MSVADNSSYPAALSEHKEQAQLHQEQMQHNQLQRQWLQSQLSLAHVASLKEPPPHRRLIPPIYPCHYKLQRAGYMCVWAGLHIALLAYYIAKHAADDWTEGLNLSSQYGILASVMGILLAMSPTFIGLLRSTPLNRFFTFEKRTHAHKFMSYILFLWTIAHSSLHYWTGVRYADSAKLTRLFVMWQDPLGITGQLMWMFFLFIGIAALPAIRRMYYEVFYYIHHLYIVNIALLYAHSQNKKAIWFVTGPLVIFVCDYLYRCMRSYPLIWSRRARIRYIKFHPSNVVEIGFDRRELLQYTKVGQYVKICVPELGIFQWHPFTLTATPSETKIMADGKAHGIWRIHFKIAGDWTRKLSQRLQKVADGGDAYTNNFDQEARIGRVVNDVIVPEVLPMANQDESEQEYVIAMANRVESNDSAVAVKQAQPNTGLPLQVQTSGPAVAAVSALINSDCRNGYGAESPLGSEQACRMPLAPKKSELDGGSFMSSNNSLFDDAWFDPDIGGGPRQAMLPTILVDGPYNAPMESFFEFQSNIIFAAGIGITPYIAALERVIEMCSDSIPTRTNQTSRDDLLPQTIYLVWVFRDVAMISLLLPILQRLRTDTRARDIVVPCMYLTGPVDTVCESTASDVFGRQMVKLPNGIRISLGRPPVSRMISYMAGRHPNSRIGVFCCAPKTMTSLVRSTVHDTNAAVAPRGTHMEMRAECFSM
ncbi:hypothetical protein GGI07_002634 [Coemansia sp. Benny D115]|nr:hypothetical protein GGI07_002634 [Coemansia sp. Benny D115]